MTSLRCQSCCTEQERELFGDQAYWSELHRQTAPRLPASATGSIGAHQSASVEQVSALDQPLPLGWPVPVSSMLFQVVKCLWGFTKVRYRGLAKNTARLYTAFALANLYLLRRRLITPQGTCHW